MWYMINGDGERCKVVGSEADAIEEMKNNDWYKDYVYSNNDYIY